MARSKRRGFSEPILCPTPKSTGGGFFHAIGAVEETADNLFVRPAVEIACVSGTASKWVIAFQVSEDPEVWPSSTTTPKFFQTSTIDVQNVEGVYYSIASGDAFENMGATAGNVNKKYIRWGVWAINNAGSSASESALVAIRVERKPR